MVRHVGGMWSVLGELCLKIFAPQAVAAFAASAVPLIYGSCCCLQHPKASTDFGEVPLQDIKMEDKDSPHDSTFGQPHTPPQATALVSAGSPAAHLHGLSSTLRVRFGDLDQSVELGELIGKGGESGLPTLHRTSGTGGSPGATKCEGLGCLMVCDVVLRLSEALVWV